MGISKLQKILKSLIESWLKDRPHRSINTLAKRSGLSKPKLYRIMRDETVEFDLVFVARLLKYVTTQDVSQKILKDYFGEDFELALNGFESSKQHQSPSELDKLYFQYSTSDPDYNTILCLGWRKSGVTKDFLIQLFGIRAEAMISDLLKEKLLIEMKPNEYQTSGDIFMMCDDPKISAKAVISGTESLIRSSSDFTTFSVSFGLNEDSIQQAKKLIHNLRKQLEKMCHDEKNHGEIPFLINLSGGQLFTESKFNTTNTTNIPPDLTVEAHP